jgi:hypothetical protein
MNGFSGQSVQFMSWDTHPIAQMLRAMNTAKLVVNYDVRTRRKNP